jgi:cyclopropane fatty-acyl-phospholipid synthase-like methyltransferase
MNRFIETKILPYLPNIAIRFFIQILFIYNLYILKKYNGPQEEKQKVINIIENNRNNAKIALSINNDNANSNVFELIYGANRFTACGHNIKIYKTLTAVETANIAVIEDKLNLSELENGANILDLECSWGGVLLHYAFKYPDLNFIGYSKFPECVEYITKVNVCKNLKIFQRGIHEGIDDTIKYDRIISIDDINTFGDYETYFQIISENLKDDGFLYLQTITHRENTIAINKTNMFSHFFTGNGDYVIPSINLFYQFQDDLNITNMECIPGIYRANMVNMWLGNLERNRDTIIAMFLKDKEYVYEQWRLIYLIISECLSSNNGREFTSTSYIMMKYQMEEKPEPCDEP